MTTTYMSAADTAKLIRKALAKHFPSTKFYVRSSVYSGGASIDIYYDGLDHFAPLVSCNCSTGPNVDPSYSANRCRTCGYIGPSPTAVYKPGAPTYDAVNAVAGKFAGSRFEGMIDLKYGVRHTIDADGNVTGSESSGSGLGDGWDALGAGTLVSFGADFVFVNHELPYDVRSKIA